MSNSIFKFALEDIEMRILCCQVTFLLSSVYTDIDNHATDFLVVRNECFNYSW